MSTTSRRRRTARPGPLRTARATCARPSHVAGVGDVNDSGFSSAAIGATYYDAGSFNEGRVYLFETSSGADADGDGTPDCSDGCPNDAGKIDPGVCGCDTPDRDGDGSPDCNDNCPADAAKTEPGICGCGVANTDGDGTEDCNDMCPTDAAKTAPGVCGCGVADTDTDGDGVADCNDCCPTDPDRAAGPGDCGCGTPIGGETDTDGDGLSNCLDGCPDSCELDQPCSSGCGAANSGCA